MDSVSESESNFFEGFDSIVAALDKIVGLMKIKGVEDVRFTFDEHPAIELEFGDYGPVAGVDPERILGDEKPLRG